MRFAVPLVSALMLCATAQAHACSYPEPPSFKDSLGSATSVFIFQVVSESIALNDRGEPLDNRIEAKIRITDVLKGAPEFTGLEFSNSWCEGNRLDVGHYFLVATSQDGMDLELVAADRSVLDVTQSYAEGNMEATNNAKLIPAVRATLSGHPLPDGIPRSRDLDYTQTLQPPPPPPIVCPVGAES